MKLKIIQISPNPLLNDHRRELSFISEQWTSYFCFAVSDSGDPQRSSTDQMRAAHPTNVVRIPCTHWEGTERWTVHVYR